MRIHQTPSATAVHTNLHHQVQPVELPEQAAGGGAAVMRAQGRAGQLSSHGYKLGSWQQLASMATKLPGPPF